MYELFQLVIQANPSDIVARRCTLVGFHFIEARTTWQLLIQMLCVHGVYMPKKIYRTTCWYEQGGMVSGSISAFVHCALSWHQNLADVSTQGISTTHLERAWLSLPSLMQYAASSPSWCSNPSSSEHPIRLHIWVQTFYRRRVWYGSGQVSTQHTLSSYRRVELIQTFFFPMPSSQSPLCWV